MENTPVQVRVGRPDCISDCPVIAEDREATNFQPDCSQARADYQRHVAASADCVEGPERRMTSRPGSLVVKCTLYGVEVAK